MMDIQERVKAHLKPNRYKHTIGVMKFAVKLAEINGIDPKKAKLAALLHDYSKYASDDEILSCFEKVHPVIKHKPNLGHGYLSALSAQKLFGVEDECILNAIRYHTFGHPDMDILAKIVYLADSLEENRSFVGVERLRDLAIQDINLGLIASIENTLKYELSKGHMIHENTIILRNKLMGEA